MKKLFTILFVLAAIGSKAQAPDSSINWAHPTISISQLNPPSKLTFRSFDSTQNENSLALFSEGRIMIYGDTAAAVKLFMKYIGENSARLNAAEEILQYITENGTVTDQKAFAAAVKRYKELKK